MIVFVGSCKYGCVMLFSKLNSKLVNVICFCVNK